MLTTVGLADVQVTWVVTGAVVPSLYVPVAANCCVCNGAKDTLLGVIAMDSSSAGETVSSVAPETLAYVAVMVLVPAVSTVAKPCVPVVLLIVATVAVDEFQFAVVVTTALVLSA